MDNSFRTPPSSPSKVIGTSPAQPILGSPIVGMPTFFYHPGSAGKSHGFTPNKTNVVSLPKHRGPSHRFIKSWNGDVISEHTSPSNPKENFEILCAQLKNLKSRFDCDYGKKLHHGFVEPRHFHAAKVLTKRCLSYLTHCYLEAPDKAYFLYLLNCEIFNGTIYNPFGLETIYNTNNLDLTMAANPGIFAAPLSPVYFPLSLVVPCVLFASPPVSAAKRARLSSSDSDTTTSSSFYNYNSPG